MENQNRNLDVNRGQDEGQLNLVELTVNIVSAYISNNRVPLAEMPALLSSVHSTVAALWSPPVVSDVGPGRPTPGQIRKSIKPNGLISFIDGKSYKTLKRHLTGNALTMDEYRERYGLPRDYPSTAASYSEQRSALAKSLGLGQRRRKLAPKVAGVADATETVSDAPTARGRRKVAEPVAEPIEKPARARKMRATEAE